MTGTSENRFVFVAPMYNASSTLRRLLHSIYGQSYDNWRLVLIDDVSDPVEATLCRNVIKSFRSFDVKGEKQVIDLWNTEKKWEVANVLRGLKECNDDDIVCRIDADDWLVDLDALKILNTIYVSTQADAIWTAHRWGFSDKNISGPMAPDANVYTHPWVSSHLKTFRKHLLNDVPYENFLNESGELVKRAGDQAIFLPALHHSQKRGYVPRCMYHYTIKDVPETYQTADARFQRDEALFLRARGYVSIGESWESRL